MNNLEALSIARRELVTWVAVAERASTEEGADAAYCQALGRAEKWAVVVRALREVSS